MKILFLGDSITDMGRNRMQSDGEIYTYGNGYVFCATADLLKENPLKYEIINRGISGNRVVDLYARIKADVWNLKPDVLSILIGVNDVWHEIGSGNGVEIDRFEKVYRMLIEDTLKVLPSVKIMLTEPFVLHGSATDENYDKFTAVFDYANVVKKLAEEYNLVFVPLQKPLDAAAEKYGANPYLFDGVHPNIAGARLIADEWIKVFNEKIK